ncbi:MAG: CidA/LrgA family protein [Bacteroidales bacterium]|nr:CidA/LrgA family protein [Bacteroidales bacterium]
MCSILIGNFIPSSVVGMILLFAALCLKVVKADAIREVATFLTDNMTVFFIPAFVGIMNQWGIIRTSFWGWCFVLVATALIVMATSGLIAELVIRMTGKKKEEKSNE